MASIRRHRHAMTALLAEYRDNRHEFEDEDTYNPKRLVFMKISVKCRTRSLKNRFEDTIN